MNDLTARLDFVRRAEQLKDTLRSAYTRSGKQESVAEHSWRLTLLVMTFIDLCPDADPLRLLKLCVLHDLGELINGDIPAPQQTSNKSTDERADFQSLLVDLPQALQAEFSDLWDEYDSAKSKEAQLAKAFDKLETILQHNQGSNPADFDYGFNLSYGNHYTDAIELTREIRSIVDRETQHNANSQATSQPANLASVEIKAFIPCTDHQQCKQFYAELGFTMASDTDGIAYFYHGNCSFLLQHCETVSQPPPMMHLLVEDVAAWYDHVQSIDIKKRYNVEVTALTDQPWGMREFILSDPSQVQWRIAQNHLTAHVYN